MGIATAQAAVGMLPFAWWLAILTYAWRASMFLGHWPSYGHPVPKDLPYEFALTNAWLDWCVPIVGLVLTTGGMAWLLRRITNYKVRMLCGSALLFGGWAAGIALLWCDPGGVQEWICD